MSFIIKKNMKVINEHEQYKHESKCKSCSKKVYLLTKRKYSVTLTFPHCKLKQSFKIKKKIINPIEKKGRACLMCHETLLATNFYLPKEELKVL